MATLTVRKLDEAAKTKLRARAALQGVSMEQRAREILQERHAGARRTGSIFEALARLGAKPTAPFDEKTVLDAMWDEGLS